MQRLNREGFSFVEPVAMPGSILDPVGEKAGRGPGAPVALRFRANLTLRGHSRALKGSFQVNALALFEVQENSFAV